MIWKTAVRTVPSPIKHLSYNNTKTPNKKDIPALLAETFLENSPKSTAKHSKLSNNQEKKKKKNQNSKNNENYNQLFTKLELQEALSKAHNTAIGPDEIHYQLMKQLSQADCHPMTANINGLKWIKFLKTYLLSRKEWREQQVSLDRYLAPARIKHKIILATWNIWTLNNCGS